MLKRLCSVFLILALMIPALVPRSTASGDVYVAVNNAMLPITDSMPIKSDGLWYIDYRCFTGGELGISGSYNADSQILTLYTWDNTLVFDIAKGTATNVTSDTSYRRKTFRSNGTIYVPANFVANQLDVRYSFISSVNVIRIKADNTVNDSVFAYIAKDEIPRLRARYEESKKQTTSSEEPSKPIIEEDEKQKTVYLTFDVGTNTDLSAILKSLRRYNTKATFFLFGSAIPMQEDEIRAAAVDGHSFGISAMNSVSAFLKSDVSVTNDLAETNDLLFETCFQKSRLVRIPGGSPALSDAQVEALIASGYRYWDWDIDASSMSLSRLTSSLSAKNSDTIIIRFDASASSTKNLASLLSYLKKNNYRSASISLLMPPQNARQDKR
ncbi:MAG: hypothetical protein E7471_04955 [Ruminococcaceae bacterium]|nr:hypothetical protein [Oscillospiraceae bacterium]